MDARTSYFSSEIKDLRVKLESLTQEVNLLIKVISHNKELKQQYKKLEENKWKY